MELDDNEEGAEFEELEADRYFDWGFSGRKMKVSYENGWFIGSIEYYNVDLGKYHIAFEDGSEDYIAPSDIDNVEVMVI